MTKICNAINKRILITPLNKVGKGGSSLFIALCLLLVALFMMSCAGIVPPGENSGEEMGLAEDFVANAQKSVELARNTGASDYSPEQLAQAEKLLAQAEESLKKRKTREAGDLAFLADTESKIATALTLEAKAKIRSAEARGDEIKLVLAAKMDESVAAKTRQVIAERMMLKAQKETENTKTYSDKEIQKARIELVIAKVELMLGLADQVKASEYAKKTYTDAKSALQRASDSLDKGNFQTAMASAEEAGKYASNAYIEARAKVDSETSEAMRARDKAITAIAKAEVLVEQAKGSKLVNEYAKDDLAKAENALKNAGIALKTNDYENSESLAQQAHLSASNAWAVAGAKERETKTQEAQEDVKANAMDIIAKLERLIAQANSAGASELASEDYKSAQNALDKSKQAMLKKDYEDATSQAREGINFSSVALAIAGAKSELKKKAEETERIITEEAVKIPQTSVVKTSKGVVINMTGEIFTKDNKIKNEAKDSLKMLADILKKYPDHKVIIEGHTDDKGTDEANLKISSERAQNLLRYLVEKEGIPLNMLSSVGYGESNPLVPNTDDESRRQNRRMGVLILI